MAVAKRNQQFQTIRTEGAILPPDILRRIASLKVEGANPGAYHLPPGTKLNEAISQSWTALLNHWQAFQGVRAKLGENGETGTATTNERWLLPLFNELDYGRLVTTKSPVIGERSYSIERFYNHTPIHLIGSRLPLDRRTKGARGAATASPHSIVQEFLNCSDEHVWAFLSNGLQLRILRDNVSLSRQTFVEFDLEAMMEGEVYSDFALLWLLCHQSRVESDKPEECWLEKWSKLAREQGTRVLNDLRVGVSNAIEALGRGFIGHPRNDQLREKLQSGALSKDDFYRQLLRIVYRLLFLFVAEDRELLHPPLSEGEGRGEGQRARDLYDTHYSTRRLRELALKMRGTKHSDLWHSLSLVFSALGKNEGGPQLGLSGLGSFLWRSSSTADLLGPNQTNGEAAFITNDDLLQAIRALAYVEQDRVLRTVDYRNLGSEELGSVYESLLELHPLIDAGGKSFSLMTAVGNERKTTGSYYTPDSLVQCLLDSALDPVVEDRLKGKRDVEAEQAILDIKVCDPASGSGHFLIAAAHRLARHLARIRTGESEPSPEDYQHALRDVISRCLYGVDINPMAVELCKVSLWMEAIEPGKPLSFLDGHIQCGNSLLGTTPALLEQGLPDDAFNPIDGDVKEIASDLRKQNNKERTDRQRGQVRIAFEPYIKLGNLPGEFTRLSNTSDNSLADVAEKERLYAQLVSGTDYQNARLLADTWCAVFVWQKDASDLGKLCPTETDFRRIENNPHNILPQVKSEVRRLVDQHQFFHWHLAFPDVFRLPGEGKAENEQTGWNAGFDVILGNPPWERVQTEELQFFATHSPDIAEMSGSDRKEAITLLGEKDLPLAALWAKQKRKDAGEAHLIRFSRVFPLTGRGKFNTFALFAELNRELMSQHGYVGCIVQSDIATSDTCKYFFVDIVHERHLVSLHDFVNTEGLFPAIHRTHPHFCLLTLARQQSNVPAIFSFWNTNASHLADTSRQFQLSQADIYLLSPNSGTCPIFRSGHDAEIVKHIYRRIPALKVDAGRDNCSWEVELARMFNMSDDASLFHSPNVVVEDNDSEDRFVPLYESKMIHLYDHRWSHSDDIDAEINHDNPNDLVRARYYVHAKEVDAYLHNRWDRQWLLGWREITNTTNERTIVASILPRSAVGHTCHLIYPGADRRDSVPVLLAMLCAFVTDYTARLKIGGTHLTHAYLKQLPIALPEDCILGEFAYSRSWLSNRVLELTYTAWDLESFALDCGYAGPPFRWDEVRRFQIRCELDAAYFHIYLGSEEGWGADSPQLRKMFPTPRDAVDYIMETFPIVKRKDKQAHGEYRTKRVILEIYDEIGEAIRTGQPYQTRLNPSPGPPADAAGIFIPIAQWDANNWPSHIHPPREVAVPVDWTLAAEAIDGDELAEVSYPATAFDRLLCAAASSAIEQAGPLPSMDHLDILELVTHPAWCKAFLDESSHSRFDAALAGIADIIAGADQPINWKQCRDYLGLRKAISIEHGSTSQPISAASEMSAVKQSFPGGVDEAVGFALKALQSIHMLRQDLAKASTVQRQIIDSFEKQHRELQLVA